MFIQLYHYNSLTILSANTRTYAVNIQQQARKEILKISYLPINCLFTVSKVCLRGTELNVKGRTKSISSGREQLNYLR